MVIAELLAGPIASHAMQQVIGPTGVDEMAVIAARHENDVVSQLAFGFRVDLPREATITGDRGTLTIPPPFSRPDRLILETAEGRRELHLPPLGEGYAHEAIEVQRCVAAGLTESPAF